MNVIGNERIAVFYPLIMCECENESISVSVVLWTKIETHYLHDLYCGSLGGWVRSYLAHYACVVVSFISAPTLLIASLVQTLLATKSLAERYKRLKQVVQNISKVNHQKGNRNEVEAQRRS